MWEIGCGDVNWVQWRVLWWDVNWVQWRVLWRDVNWVQWRVLWRRRRTCNSHEKENIFLKLTVFSPIGYLALSVLTPIPHPLVRPTFCLVRPAPISQPTFRERLIALMMEAVSTSETSVNFYETTRCNIPEDRHLRSSRRQNLKSEKSLFIWKPACCWRMALCMELVAFRYDL
jgi:hypothetical protein